MSLLPRSPRLIALVVTTAALGFGVAACGAPPVVAKVAPKAKAGGKKAWKPLYPSSRLFPDVSLADVELIAGPREIESHPGEQSRIHGRMRITVADGGVIKRADDLLPVGRVTAVELPGRLGGGFVFAVVNGRGTQIFRSEQWLTKLKPLVEHTSPADPENPVVVGFDRLFLRLSSNDVIAINPQNGQQMPTGSLPIAPYYGDMVFVDGWRAVIDTDLRGVMATFDAGATWQTVAVNGHVRAITEIDGDPSIVVEDGEYRLDDHGALNFTPTKDPTPAAHTSASTKEKTKKPKPSPLGKKPFRAAIEDGYPEDGRTAVVARNGALGRVSLDDGSVIAVKEHVVPETASCHGIKLGPGFGFVCGEVSGRTTLYEYEAPLSMKLVAEFDDPRVVTESGQGLVVISGTCERKNEEPAPIGKDKKIPRSFCVRAIDGAMREIRVRGNLGSERIVALADGRVVVLVPPRAGAMGQLSIIDKSAAKHVTIKIPDDAPIRELEQGLWLDGFQESAPGEIAGWVESGGPMLGVRIKIDGTLQAGQLVEEDNGVLVSGPFGLAVGMRGRALETIDGGITWEDIILPVQVAPSPDLSRPEERTRRCGPTGCALPGILRVGWGASFVPDDLKEAADPPTLRAPLSSFSSPALKLECRAIIDAAGKGGATKPSASYGAWGPFRGVDPPTLAKDEIGLDHGSPFDQSPVRGYVWGKKDADWIRTGRYLIRFSDRFSVDDVRSSVPTQSIWDSETSASDSVGVGQYGYATTWTASPESSGKSAIVSACRNGKCDLFGVDDGRPVLAFRPGRGASTLLHPMSAAIRIGESWYYLAEGSAFDRLALYRVDLGTVRLLREYPRPRLSPTRNNRAEPPSLVRRSSGAGLGLAFRMKTSFTDRKGELFVVPLDPDTGALGDAIDIGRRDLGTLSPGPCDSARDGWLITLPANDPNVEVALFESRFRVDGADVRLRMDPGFSCIEAVAAQADHEPSPPEKSKTAKVGERPAGTYPLVINDLASGKRSGFACSTKPRAPDL